MYHLLNLTEEQVSIIMQALQYWQYNYRHINLEQWDIAETVIAKIDDII